MRQSVGEVAAEEEGGGCKHVHAATDGALVVGDMSSNVGADIIGRGRVVTAGQSERARLGGGGRCTDARCKAREELR